jgi:phenylalanyl-tRNA synthetase alpha chain
MKIDIKPIKKEELDKYLSVEDLTKSSGNHVIKLLYEIIKDYVTKYHNNSEVKEYRLDPIVDVKDNYDNLLVDKDNISRSSTYTHYVTKDTVLRTHTSAQMPRILKELSKRDDWDDVVILLPGLVYRRDLTDRKHLSVIQQLEMWRVCKASKSDKVERKDLLEVINGLSEVCAPGWRKRNVDKIHPYTTEGIEVNLVKGDKDIEILEGGLIHPQILINAGLDPNKYSGWAMGMGLDRLAMILKGIPDIRYLRSNNPRIRDQMYDLNKYIEVSLQPAIKRDMSYCIPISYVEEDIHQEIKKAIGNDERIIESIEILKEINYEQMDEEIRTKIGCTKKMKNILVRIILRDLEKTLTKKDANKIYELIYEKVNYGNNVYK